MTFFEMDDILSSLESVYYIQTRGGEHGKSALCRRFAWYSIFRDFDFADVKNATIEAAKTHPQFPAIADVIEILKSEADRLEGLL